MRYMGSFLPTASVIAAVMLVHAKPGLSTKQSSRPASKPSANANALKDRAGAEAKAGKTDAAIFDYTKVLAQDPSDYGSLMERAGLYRNAGKTDKAIADLSKAASLKPTAYEAFSELGLALFAVGRMPGAMAAFDQALKLNPNSAQLYCSRGTVAAASGSFDRALSDFDKCLAIDPNNAGVLYQRAMCHVSSRDLPKAIDDFTKALALKPDYAEALEGRGNSYVRTGEFESAIADFSQALNLPGNKEARLVQRGCAYLEYATHARKDAPKNTYKTHVIGDIKPTQSGDVAICHIKAADGTAGADGAITVELRDHDQVPLSDGGVFRQTGVIWTLGSIHIILGKLILFGYTFDSDPVHPLGFQMTSSGYTYLGGKGTVTAPSGKIWNPDAEDAASNDAFVTTVTKAIDDFDAAIASNASLKYVYFVKGLALHAMGKDDDALASFQRSLEVDGYRADVNMNRVRALIAGVVDLENKDGVTALMAIVLSGNLDSVKSLIAAGADVNAKDKDGWTALMYAAETDKPDCLKALVTAGADLNAVNKNGTTSLMLAKSDDVATVLRTAGATK